jgi:hypothetical protein
VIDRCTAMSDGSTSRHTVDQSAVEHQQREEPWAQPAASRLERAFTRTCVAFVCCNGLLDAVPLPLPEHFDPHRRSGIDATRVHLRQAETNECILDRSSRFSAP